MNIFKKIIINKERKKRLEYLKELRPYQQEYFILTLYWKHPLTLTVNEYKKLYVVTREEQYNEETTSRRIMNQRMQNYMEHGFFRNNMGKDKATSVIVDSPLWATCVKISLKKAELFYKQQNKK